MKMKNKIKTTYEKADELLWNFEDTGELDFAVGSKDNICKYKFPQFGCDLQEDDTVEIIPFTKDAKALSTDEVSIFIFKTLFRVQDALASKIEYTSNKAFQLLYRYNQFLLHKLSAIHPGEITFTKNYITNKKKFQGLKNILEAQYLEFKGTGTRFLLSKCEPVDKTRELFAVFDDLIYEYTNDERLVSDDVVFDPRTGKVTYKGEMHSFQRGQDGNMDRFSLFKILWEDRKKIKNGITTRQGDTNSIDYLASGIGFIGDPSDLINKKRQDFIEILRGINRCLKKKKMPLKIDFDDKTAVQLVVSEM
jgi:hypothetical protein